MLSDLDTIDWASMEHAYGSAEDVPDILRGLLSDDANTREAALDDMHGGVHHQGDIYDSTVACIPFLLRIVAMSGAPDRGPVLEFLESIGSTVALEGEDSDEVMASYRVQAHAAVLAGLPIFLACLADTDPATRRGAATALTACWERFETVLSALQQCFRMETDQSTRVALIHAVGILARRQSATGGDIANISPWLLLLALSDENSVLRLAAFTELAHLSPEALPGDGIARMIAAIAAAYAESEATDTAVQHTPAVDTAGGVAPSTLIGTVRTLFEGEAKGKRLPDMHGVLNGLHDALGDRIQDRIGLITHELTAPGWDRPCDAVWHAIRLIRNWRGDYGNIARLLGQYLAASEPRLRARAAETLAEMFALAAPAADDLARLLASTPPAGWVAGKSVRPVVKALARIGDDRVLPALRAILDRQDMPEDIGFVVRSFPNIRADDFVPRICRRLSDAADAENGDWLLRSLVHALGGFGPAAASAVPDLLALMRRAPAKDYIMEALGRIGPAAGEAGPAIRERLGSDTPDMAVTAAIALWRIEENAGDVLPVLLGNLGGRHASQTADALGRLGPAAMDAVPRLRGQLSGDSPWHRRAAALALWRITGDAEAALPALRTLWRQHPHQRPHIAEHLCEMGATAALIEPLLREEIAAARRHNASDTGHSSHQVDEDEIFPRTCQLVLDRITVSENE